MNIKRLWGMPIAERASQFLSLANDKSASAVSQNLLQVKNFSASMLKTEIPSPAELAAPGEASMAFGAFVRETLNVGGNFSTAEKRFDLSLVPKPKWAKTLHCEFEKTRRRKHWTREEKDEIIKNASESEEKLSVAEKRYGLYRGQLKNWIKAREYKSERMQKRKEWAYEQKVKIINEFLESGEKLSVVEKRHGLYSGQMKRWAKALGYKSEQIRERRQWTYEQKDKILEEALNSGNKFAQVEKEHSLSYSQPHHWRRSYQRRNRSTVSTSQQCVPDSTVP